jgi:glutamyl-tRNA synthetase
VPAPRTRFAPSPTGFLHIGSARTALFNWAFTRRLGGTALLRIEDTDRERSTPEAEAAIYDGLAWLEIDWDEAPTRQSDRAERHRAAVEELLAKDHAYRCVCTREELEARKQAWLAAGRKWTYDGRCREAAHGPGCGPHTVRIRVPEDGVLEWDDLVYGPSGQDAREIGDAIVRRSDGTPLYNLAVVVDDLDLGITHVVRGADHHSNTPLQIAIYRALDAEPPRFAHLPLIVGKDGRKLSKRRDPVSLQQFRDEGYLAEAMRNWLVRIGWSHGDQEIFSRDDIVRLFGLEAVHRAGGQADPAKLAWLNQHYLKSLESPRLLAELAPFLARVAGRSVPVAPPAPGLARLVDLLRERARTLAELAQRASFLVCDAIEIDPKAAARHLRPERAPALRDLLGRLAELPEWDDASLEQAFLATAAAQGGLPLAELAQPVRVAVTGSAASPGIYETLAVLGRARSLARIEAALARLARAPESSPAC